MTDEYYMSMALAQARAAAAEGEIPIGAVIVGADGSILAAEHNRTEALRDVTAHAEMLAIGAAAALTGSKYLTDSTLYVTVEPCAMCAAAIGWAQIPRVVIGAPDPKRGYSVMYARSPFHPRATIITGILQADCSALMLTFFRSRRTPSRQS